MMLELILLHHEIRLSVNTFDAYCLSTTSHLDTVFGESAGAFAVSSFLVAGGGKTVKNLNLFRGAIIESGAPSGYVFS